MSLGTHSGRVVAIVTGGSLGPGRDVARGLARWAWPIVIVYLEHQPSAEATAAEIVTAGGATVTVRADLADDLDVQRLFTESIAEFGSVDVVVHATADDPGRLYDHAARYVRQGGVIVSIVAVGSVPPRVASRLRERGIITVGQVSPEVALAVLDRWRQETVEPGLGNA